MATAAATQYITDRVQNAEAPEEVTALVSIKELYEKRLWHQLTEEMKKVIFHAKVSDKRSLYERFLREFESKLNPVSLVQIADGIVRAEFESSATEALEFLKPMITPKDEKDTVVTVDPDAHVLLLSIMAILHMQDGDRGSSKHCVEAARDLVDTTRELLPLVNSAFYRAAAEYHKVVGTASDFFRNALQFLAYTPPETLPVNLQRQWAFDIGTAALVGSDIYNFGEVLNHLIIQSLRRTESEWLLLLLEAFNKGDLRKFDEVCKANTAQITAQPVLVLHEEFLKQKITVLALLELAFSRSLEHSIPFKDVETACRLPADEVEYLLMRSMSLGLISGVIDNVDQSVSITRVQPRVLGREPIGKMAERLSKWCSNVSNTVTTMKKGTVGLVE